MNQVQLRAAAQAPAVDRPRAGPVLAAVRADHVGPGPGAARGGSRRGDAGHPDRAARRGVRPVRRRGHLRRPGPQRHHRRVPAVLRRGVLPARARLLLPGERLVVAGREAPSLVAWIYEMRMLNAMLAGATAVVLVQLTARVSSLGRPAGRGAVRPGPVLHQAERPGAARDADDALGPARLPGADLAHRPAAPAWARTRAIGAGLLFGIAVLTKDEAALITILPLAAAAVLRWGPPGR